MRREVGPVFCVGLLLCILLLTPISTVAGEEAGDIILTQAGVQLNPTLANEGETVGISVTLFNNASGSASNVVVEFHKDVYSPPSSLFFQMTIPSIGGDGFGYANSSWSNLAAGQRALVIRFEHSGQSAFVTKQFNVTGLPNLKVLQLTAQPSSGIQPGDLVSISGKVENNGNGPADASHLLYTLGQQLAELEVPALLVGQSAWVNTSFNAPAAGTHQLELQLNSQAADGVQESSTADNSMAISIAVDAAADYLHLGQVSSVEQGGTLAGPWEISGSILRQGGQGSSTLDVSIRHQAGVTIRTFQLSFTEQQNLREWSESLTVTDLGLSGAGTYTLEVVIDAPNSIVEANEANNIINTSVSIHPEPNVVVSTRADSSTAEALVGEAVTFSVTVQNVGVVAVSGQLRAFWDEQQIGLETRIITPYGGVVTVNFSVTVEGDETRSIPFRAEWTASNGSFDSILDDNVATSSVQLVSNLRLAFLILTENLEPSPPLRQGETYTYSIQIESLAGSGSETFSCRDTGKDEVLDIKTLQFSSAGDNQTLTCTFTVEDPGQITLILIPNGASTASHVVSSFSVNAGGSGSGPDSGNTDLGFMILMIFGVLVLTAILVAAFVLTRVVFSSTERETYDYCPACDGEIEGDEDLCPHCDFDLIKGRRQFHDCEKCEASIPDMLDHCPYCGTTQSAADRFERRERKFVEPEPEPEEEESDVEESDSDEIVAGSEDFESQVAGMGWDESQYEDEWDESLERAEQQIDDVARVRMEQMIQSLEDEDQVAETTLGKYVSAEVLDLDGIVGEKDERRHLRDEGGELSASDADIRAEIYEVTGETGVLPGDEITVDTMYDAAASVGDEIPEEIGTADFSGIDDSEPPRRRRAIRRKSSDSDDKDATDSVSSEDDAA